MDKTVSILGSTGSIGTQTLDVVRLQNRLGKEPMKVQALCAGRDAAVLEEQIREVKNRIQGTEKRNLPRP